MNFLHPFLFRLTGGHPMTRAGRGFIDRVSGKAVNYYIDARWGWFRVNRRR
jgi:hypothetical protein